MATVTGVAFVAGGRWSVRPAEVGDETFLRQMLHLALYVPDGAALPESVLDEPQLRHYFAGFGQQEGDLGVIAVDSQDGEAPVGVGACWLRRFPPDHPGYGWVAPDVPELSIAVIPEARGHGLGTGLIESVLETAAARGVERVSLSVDPRSPAHRLYRRLGFERVGEADTSITMVKATSHP